METNQATENLQVIRTLMERSALYRRALAPVMIFCGVMGSTAGIVGWLLKIHQARSFILYWALVAAVSLAGSFILVRRQALRDAEPFWSPPTRRIGTALLPPFTIGFILSLIALVKFAPGDDPDIVALFWIPLAWVALYGCGLCASGFFASRGINLFGWIQILGSCALLALINPNKFALNSLQYSYGIMTFFFGALHIAYGIYLYFTEQGKNVA
jgi:hypothetical protein